MRSNTVESVGYPFEPGGSCLNRTSGIFFLDLEFVKQVIREVASTYLSAAAIKSGCFAIEKRDLSHFICSFKRTYQIRKWIEGPISGA